MNTPRFRVSYPNVFEPKVNKLSGKEEYSVLALFPKGADLSALHKAAEEAAIKKWGKDNTKWPKNLRSPFRDQGEKAKNIDGEMVLPPAHEDGAFFMNLKSKDRPHVVDKQVNDILDRTEFYAGCWAIASVNAYAYDQMGNAGISFGLGNIQKVADGDPLGGRTSAAHDFAPIDSDEGTDSDQGAGGIFG